MQQDDLTVFSPGVWRFGSRMYNPGQKYVVHPVCYVFIITPCSTMKVAPKFGPFPPPSPLPRIQTMSLQEGHLSALIQHCMGEGGRNDEIVEKRPSVPWLLTRIVCSSKASPGLPWIHNHYSMVCVFCWSLVCNLRTQHSGGFIQRWCQLYFWGVKILLHLLGCLKNRKLNLLNTFSFGVAHHFYGGWCVSQLLLLWQHKYLREYGA